ncbi:MAG: hypothetical protein IT552_02780 [Sphingomonadaceae bacterium]|nr:hypothetical protein [Sphingomonadaceae bacterium]
MTKGGQDMPCKMTGRSPAAPAHLFDAAEIAYVGAHHAAHGCPIRNIERN